MLDDLVMTIDGLDDLDDLDAARRRPKTYWQRATARKPKRAVEKATPLAQQIAEELPKTRSQYDQILSEFHGHINRLGVIAKEYDDDAQKIAKKITTLQIEKNRLKIYDTKRHQSLRLEIAYWKDRLLQLGKKTIVYKDMRRNYESRLQSYKMYYNAYQTHDVNRIIFATKEAIKHRIELIRLKKLLQTLSAKAPGIASAIKAKRAVQVATRQFRAVKEDSSRARAANIKLRKIVTKAKDEQKDVQERIKKLSMMPRSPARDIALRRAQESAVQYRSAIFDAQRDLAKQKQYADQESIELYDPFATTEDDTVVAAVLGDFEPEPAAFGEFGDSVEAVDITEGDDLSGFLKDLKKAGKDVKKAYKAADKVATDVKQFQKVIQGTDEKGKKPKKPKAPVSIIAQIRGQYGNVVKNAPIWSTDLHDKIRSGFAKKIPKKQVNVRHQAAAYYYKFLKSEHPQEVADIKKALGPLFDDFENILAKWEKETGKPIKKMQAEYDAEIAKATKYLEEAKAKIAAGDTTATVKKAASIGLPIVALTVLTAGGYYIYKRKKAGLPIFGKPKSRIITP